MKQLNDRAESPIEILLVVMGTILTMTVLILTIGNFVDLFLYEANQLILAQLQNTTLIGMYNNIVVKYSTWFFLVPIFFVLLTLIWGVKTVIKKHEYTTQNTQFMADEY